MVYETHPVCHLLDVCNLVTLAMLDCSQRNVQRLVTNKALQPVRIGGLRRLRIADIDTYIANAGADLADLKAGT